MTEMFGRFVGEVEAGHIYYFCNACSLKLA